MEKESVNEANEVHQPGEEEARGCDAPISIDWVNATNLAESWRTACGLTPEGKRTTSRPTFKMIYMALAELMSTRSTCKRLKVGTVVTSIDFRKVLAVGYNGNASSLPNTCDTEEPGACGCLHSEENAIINCDAPREQAKYVFVTHLPCKMCAKRIVNLGNVVRVFYRHDYRTADALNIFSQVSPLPIQVEKI